MIVRQCIEKVQTFHISISRYIIAISCFSIIKNDDLGIRLFIETFFRVGQSEVLPFEDNSVDLVTCCQAIHWFDIPKFYQDVNRVLRPKGGVLAVYGYHLTGPAPNAGLNKDQIKGLEDLRNNVSFTKKFYAPSTSYFNC